MELKPQDLVVLYKQVAQAGQVWTYASLGEALGMSPSQVHRSVKRAVASGLALEKSRGEWETVRTALHEFAVHGVPPLSIAISSSPGDAPVWPSAQGTAKGPSLSPLSTGVPNAAMADPALHQLLALQDALRYLKQSLGLGDAV
ncbi:UNVERIFIED_ORG: hypothetical protein GGR68_003835 [Xanthomonas campestris]|uniref:AsnC family protein n=1 Tax=Xanthomonas arboricola TaxID=56448 RepID=UPI001613846E